MTQTAHNGTMAIDSNTWTLVSEVDCTFVVLSGRVEVLGMDGAAPGSSDAGIPYKTGQGEDAATGTLARFTGAGTADRIYMRAKHPTALIFLSREAVA